MSVEALLPDYIAGELSDADRARVEEALARSPRLQTELARYRQLFVLLAVAALDEVETPAGLEGRIVRRIAVQWYLNSAANLLEELLRAYGRAIVHYLRLA